MLGGAFAVIRYMTKSVMGQKMLTNVRKPES